MNSDRLVVNASPIISLARIDDKPAKRCAESFAIRVRGTIALIVEAKRRRLVPEAGPLLLKLKSNGLQSDVANA
jgi:predicted nucleic acid-binding protein